MYVSAALSFVTGRPLAYAVTAKGDLASPDRLRTFEPHLIWITGGLLLIFVGMLVGPGTDAPGCRVLGLGNDRGLLHSRSSSTWLRRAGRSRPQRRLSDFSAVGGSCRGSLSRRCF